MPNLHVAIIANYHGLKKGLAIPDRKPEFGKDVAKVLIRRLRNWEKRNYGSVMLSSFGRLKERSKVACSARNSITEAMKEIS